MIPARLPSRRCSASLLALCASLGMGCLHRVPPQRLESPLPIALVLLEDRGDETRGLPDAARTRMEEELEERNLIVREVAPEPLLGGARNSEQRFAALQGVAGDAGLALLVETRVAYYDLLEGQYRWVVHARFTAQRRGAQAQPAHDDADIPVFLQYEHQREEEALESAARVIAERAAMLIDGFIAPPGQPATPPPRPANQFAPPGTPGTRLEAPGFTPGALPAQARAASTPTPGAAAVRALGNIYFVLLDRFADGDVKNDEQVDRRDPDAFHGGDLQGVLDRLDDLQRLGVQTLWLSPVFATRHEKFYGHGAYHGYWVEELNRVEPRFGDEALLQKLSNELHRRGMKLLLDLVLNHVAFDSPLLRAHPDWFHHNGSIEDWNDPTQLETRDVNGLPDLMQENEQVYQMLLSASLGWIDRVHPDGFRLDAVKHVPLAFWRRFNDAVHAHAGPSFVLLGEALEGSPVKLAALARTGGFDSLFDFPLGFALGDVFCKGADPERLGALLSLDRLYPDAASLVTLVVNHDLPRARTLCGGDEDKVAQLLLVLGFLRGVPAIQYGTEAGLAGAKEPENRGDLFGLRDPRAEAAVVEALRLHRFADAMGPSRSVILAASGGAVALVRVEGDGALLALLARGPSAHWPAMERVLAPFAGSVFEGCTGLAAGGTRRRDCPLEFAADEVRVVRLRASHPGAFAALLPSGGTRAVGFRADDWDPTQSSGQLFIAGAGPELGDWDPARALGPLSPASRSIQLPVRSVLEFKLILKRPDGTVTWASGQDQFLFVDEGAGSQEVVLAWRS